ncbi:MAG: DNA replication and repair protein RecF [Treponema sp.]|nr:DNA replication and repair protein RecF [Treponema sp.]
MIISFLRTAAFRNLADATVATSAKNIFLVGENGQGKSNFLEAIYFCSYASSFRGVRDSDIAQNGKNNFSAEITITPLPAADNPHSDVLIKFEKNKKTVLIDGKRAEDRKQLLSIAPCIVFCHEDMEFITGSPERRRWFFDQVLSLSDPVYLDDLRRYRWILKSRNSILRNLTNGTNIASQCKDDTASGQELLDALDSQFVIYGLRLMEKRETAARLFSEVFTTLYEEVSGVSGMTVQYMPSWKNVDENETLACLLKRRPADFAAGISLSGPHRDRYAFSLDGTDFAGYASTGQRRLLALLLRVAQARRYSGTTGRKPILLLDDVLLEMDSEKRRRFLSVLPGYDQAFYTFLPDEPYQRYQNEDTLIYFVRNGILENASCYGKNRG